MVLLKEFFENVNLEEKKIGRLQIKHAKLPSMQRVINGTLSSTGSILSNTDLSDLSTVGTCDIFVYQMRHGVM